MAKCISPVENQSVYYFQYGGVSNYIAHTHTHTHAYKSDQTECSSALKGGLNAASYNENIFVSGVPA